MKEKPIIFSTEMVRAILDGRKSQTRRLIKPQPDLDGLSPSWVDSDHIPLHVDDFVSYGCSPYQKGDHLWVREVWRVGAWNQEEMSIAVDYKADGCCRKEWLLLYNCEQFERLWEQSTDDAEKEFGPQEFYKWKPGESPCRWRSSLFMSKWAARLWLEILDVRVERVQDISYDDLRAEGIEWHDRYLEAVEHASAVGAGTGDISRWIFANEIWDTIHKKKPEYQWQANPWVWVYEFKKIEKG